MMSQRALLLLPILFCGCAGSGSSADDYPDFVEGARPPTYDTVELFRNLIHPAHAREIATRVVVQAKINEKGEVVEVVVVKTDSVQLGEAVVEAVRKTTFMPAMYDGKPIRMRITIPIIIELEE